jgi:hypothetical protein
MMALRLRPVAALGCGGRADGRRGMRRIDAGTIARGCRARI